MMKTTCPKCKRTNLVFQIFAPTDIKAICRHVRQCGFRSSLIIDGVKMTDQEKMDSVNAEYQRKCNATEPS